MPLTKKDGEKLVANIAKHIEEEKWLAHDVNKLEKEGKLKKKEADEIRNRQAQARKDIDKIENEITKTIVARFPSKFGKPPLEKKEAPTRPKEVVVPKEEPKIIEVPRSVLERINSGIEAQAEYFSSYEEIAKEQLEAFNTIKEVTEEEKAIREDYSEFVYPPSGGTMRIPIGTTVLDLWTGDVYLGDGKEGKLSDSLMGVGQLYARSIYIDTNKAFTVQLDGKTPHSISDSGFFSRKGVQCRKVSVEVTESALLKFIASTNPDASFSETANVIAVGVATPLYTKQIRWHLSWSTTIAPYSSKSSVVTYSGENVRLKLDKVGVSVNKSCIMIHDFYIGDTLCVSRRFDIQDEFEIGNVVLELGEVTKQKISNLSNETLNLDGYLSGLEEET